MRPSELFSSLFWFPGFVVAVLTAWRLMPRKIFFPESATPGIASLQKITSIGFLGFTIRFAVFWIGSFAIIFLPVDWPSHIRAEVEKTLLLPKTILGLLASF